MKRTVPLPILNQSSEATIDVGNELEELKTILQRIQIESCEVRRNLQDTSLKIGNIDLRISNIEGKLKKKQQNNSLLLSVSQILTHLIVLLVGVILLITLADSGKTEKVQSQITFDIGTALIGVAAVSATVIYGLSQQGRNSEHDSDGE